MQQQSGDSPGSSMNKTNARVQAPSTEVQGSLRPASGSVQLTSAVNKRGGDESHDAKHRHQLIAVAAYYRAEARGFAPGFEVSDWLAAERILDL